MKLRCGSHSSIRRVGASPRHCKNVLGCDSHFSIADTGIRSCHTNPGDRSRHLLRRWKRKTRNRPILLPAPMDTKDTKSTPKSITHSVDTERTRSGRGKSILYGGRPGNEAAKNERGNTHRKTKRVFSDLKMQWREKIARRKPDIHQT